MKASWFRGSIRMAGCQVGRAGEGDVVRQRHHWGLSCIEEPDIGEVAGEDASAGVGDRPPCSTLLRGLELPGSDAVEDDHVVLPHLVQVVEEVGRRVVRSPGNLLPVVAVEAHAARCRSAASTGRSRCRSSAAHTRWTSALPVTTAMRGMLSLGWPSACFRGSRDCSRVMVLAAQQVGAVTVTCRRHLPS